MFLMIEIIGATVSGCAGRRDVIEEPDRAHHGVEVDASLSYLSEEASDDGNLDIPLAKVRGDDGDRSSYVIPWRGSVPTRDRLADLGWPKHRAAFVVVSWRAAARPRDRLADLGRSARPAASRRMNLPRLYPRRAPRCCGRRGSNRGFRGLLSGRKVRTRLIGPESPCRR